MKIDINSLVELIGNYKDNIVDIAHAIYDIVIDISDSDEDEMINTINNVINGVCNYIMSISSVDEVYSKVTGLLTGVVEAASLTTFKGFNVSEDHPGLYDDDGILYVKGDFYDDDEEEKYLIACPATKTGKVRIDDGTTDVLMGAFALCNLDEVVIPSTVTKLQPITFALSNIGEMVIPESVEEIGEAAFTAANISTLKLENRTFFENGDYRNSSFVALFADEIVLPDDLETIPTQVFTGCLTKSYKLPSDLVNIGNAAFLANILLESIDIPAKTEYIGSGAFLGCIKLEEVDFKSQFIFGNKLKTIGDTAFTLTSVKEFNLPENLENIGVLALNPSVNGAIQYLNALIRPMLEELLEDSGEEGNHIDIDKFDINKVNETLEHVASWFTNNAGVTVDSGNRNFKAVDGDLYSYDKTRLIKVAETKSGLYEIPSSVMTVSGGAFAFTAVEDVYIPDSVNTLENGAFAYSLVSEITIGGGIREIPSGVFMGCPLLDRVTILPTVVSIDEDAFDGCPKDFAIVGYAYSYAHEYAIEHEINFETIDGKGYITIKAPSEVASAFVPVYGNTLKNTDVEIYIDGTKVGDTVSEENGYWRATVEIPEPINNKIYSITAKIDAGTEKEIESSVVFVTYSTTVPAFESITCYHGSQRRTITMDTIDIVPDYMSFNSYNPFTYEIKLSAYDSTKTLYVVSGGYRIPAVYDAKTDTYIATGYFGRAGGSHVPEYVTLELGGCTLANTSFRFPFIIDPSGFIYEAVHSNRVEGAVVSIFFRDENDLAQLWEEAFIYGQESSIITGSEGLFSWDVPNGFWQVKAEKEDYETGLSDWLPVPPEQLEVYVGLITKLSPNVKYVNGYSDGIDITFDQYMDMTTVNSENIVVTDESDDIVEGSWSPVNPEVSGTDSSVYYATTFTFTPETTLEGSYIVNVNNVENYADKAISVPYVGTVTVKQRVETLSAPESLGLIYGHDYTDSTDNVIVLDGGSGAAGLTVNVALGDDFYVESVTTVTFDEEGKAAITINPTRPGVTTVSFNLDGTNLVEKTQIVVSMPEETRVTGITLSKESVELQVDAEKQITANVAPEFATNRTVIWSSSDSSVATVDENGIVKAVKVGKATVTATTVDGGFTASCEVNVVAPASYTVTWIIDGVEHKQTLSEGDKIVVPEATEKEGYIFKGWSAEIPSVMPAENLTFTAIYEKIEAPAVKVTGVTISDSSAEIFVGAGKQLSANVVPADATNKSVTWSSSDRSVATVDGNGLVKGVKAGQATITVTTADGGFTAECTVTVEVETHKVTWIIDGVETTQTVAVGEKLTAPEVTEKEGYTFTGWTPEVPSKMPAEDVTFTAMFTANKYNAVFNANGGAWSDGSSEKPVPTEYGTEIEAPEAPARDGYLFAGWTPDVGIMDDVNGKTFNAVWISETETFYTVETYTMNTVGEYEKSSKVIVADAGESVTAEYTVPTGFSYNANKSVDRGTVAEDNSLVLKIYLDRNTYKFTTVVDGVSTSASYLYGAMVSEPVTPVKDGYKFVKWDKAVPETMPAEDVTITAEFERFYICPDCGKEFIGEDAINKHIAEEEKSKIKATIEIKNNPGSKTIKYGETLELTAVVTDMPADAIIVWYLDGEQKGEGEKFGVYFEGGTKTVEVKLVDASGNVLEDADGNEISDSEEVTVKAGFWQKLVSFFKNLFRMNRTIVQSIFKGVF